MKRLAEYIKWYMYITTSILVVCAINVTSEGMDVVPAEILGQFCWLDCLPLWSLFLSGLGNMEKG